jgi:hypothetical protein
MSNNLSAQATRPYKFSILRVLLCGVLLTALVAVCLYLDHTAFDFYQARLLENQSKTFAWFVEQIGFSLPFIVICLFHLMVYHKHDRRDGVARREMFWEVVMVTVLTYAVLLPYLAKISDALYINALAAGETVPKTDGRVELTLLMELHDWFIRFTIPLALLMGFHAMRARREILHPETEAVADAPMTVAAYEAQKAAALEAQRAAEAEANRVDEVQSEESAPDSISEEEQPHES